MSRIGPATDRPIPTDEITLKTQQTSETESIQKTGITGEALIDAEQVTKEKAPETETKGQQFESRLGGLARQTELQSQFPLPTAPTLKDLPDANPNLNPNIHVDEKIDVTKNLPDGQAINSGLAGLDWGIGKGKTGPNHMGVDITTGGMKAPTDVLADVLNDGKLGQPNTSAPKQGGQEGGGGNTQGSVVKESGGGNANSGFISKGGGNSGPPPGVQVNSNAPKWGLVGQATAGEYQTIFGPGPKASTPQSGDAKKQTEGLEAKAKEKPVSEETKKAEEAWKKKEAGKMTDPDAGGGGGPVGGGSPEEIERALKVHFGQVEHTINPDLGVSGGPTSTGDPEEMKRPIDLVRDPIDDETETGVMASSDGKAKLAMDIHGPRTVNPDSGYQPPISGGVRAPGTGPDPNTGNLG